MLDPICMPLALVFDRGFQPDCWDDQADVGGMLLGYQPDQWTHSRHSSELQGSPLSICSPSPEEKRLNKNLLAWLGSRTSALWLQKHPLRSIDHNLAAELLNSVMYAHYAEQLPATAAITMWKPPFPCCFTVLFEGSWQTFILTPLRHLFPQEFQVSSSCTQYMSPHSL